jgi:hypothetical protein
MRRLDTQLSASKKKTREPSMSGAAMWLDRHHVVLRGALADFSVLLYILAFAFGWGVRADFPLVAQIAIGLFLYGSCADGGAGLVAGALCHPLLLKLGEYSMVLYVWQAVYF